MPKTGAQIIQILRNVTGRVDASDPLFTDTVMLGYVNDVLNLEMPQDARLFENKTWWEFTIDPTTLDPLPVDLAALGYSTIGPPAFVWVNNNVSPTQITRFALWWYQDPAVFFAKWPQVTGATPQRPQDVLYYNNELIFRGPPDQQYVIQIQANRIEAVLSAPSDEITNSYFWRYVAYAAALDIFSDYGEMDKYNQTMPAYMRYRSMMYARTNQQYQNQRPYPTF
jgi:hypothetical protein